MSHPVLSWCDPTVAGGYLHVQAWVVDAIPHLIQGSHTGKYGVCSSIGYEPGRGHARCCGHHILLGYAEIERTLREFLGEIMRAD